MIFEKIIIEGFKSFNQKAVVDFRDFGFGLNFVTGKNLVEPDLGANGVGKSTLWDALYWVLYGRTLQGLKASGCASWEHVGNPKVTLIVRLLGKRRVIRRIWKPNKLEIRKNKEWHSITQDELQAWVVLDEDTFRQSIIIAQNSRMFFDLKPAEKLTVFTELMDLDYWLECSRDAQDKTESMWSDMHDLHEKREAMGAIFEVTKRMIVENTELLKKLEKEEAAKKALVKGKISKIETKLKEVHENYEKKNRAWRKLKSELKPDETKLAHIGHEVGITENERNSLSSKSAVIDSKLAEANVQLDELNNSQETGKCPACGQDITIAHLDTEIEKLNDKVNKLKKSRKVLRSKIKVNEESLSSITETFNKKRKELDHEKDDLKTLEGTCIKLSEQTEGFKTQLKMLKRDTDSSSLGMLSNSIERKKQEVKGIKFSIKKLKKKIQELEGHIKATEFWVKSFKDIRLHVIQETLMALEVEVNNSLVDLGMEEWTVKFDIERETKSGSMSRGFQVLISSPESGNELVPFEAWSGGEGQRLKIAGTIGIANLILRQRGIESNIQVWDEPLYGLSGSGVDDALELFREQAKRSKKQIWLVDHRTLNFGFDHVLYINKDNNGSHIVTIKE